MSCLRRNTVNKASYERGSTRVPQSTFYQHAQAQSGLSRAEPIRSRRLLHHRPGHISIYRLGGWYAMKHSKSGALKASFISASIEPPVRQEPALHAPKTLTWAIPQRALVFLACRNVMLFVFLDSWYGIVCPTTICHRVWR
ncbi:hypothetical protein ACGC1H_005883 [Rhizoctonia solani]